MGSLVAAAAPIAGAYFGGPTGAMIGSAIGGALAGGESVGQDNRNLQQAAQMSQFRPVGVTTNFGTSNFGFDEQGRLNQAGYNLSPQLQGYQDQLAGMTGQGLQAGQGLMSLGQQYLGESPDAVRQRYMQQQQALLAPQQEQQLAGIRNNLFQTGRGGLATGATEAGGMAATNPEMAAYYNSLARQNAALTAGADQAAQQQVTFGQGLLSSAYSPLQTNVGLNATFEQLAQSPLDIGAQLGGRAATAGAQVGQTLMQGGTNAANAMFKANSQSPWGNAISSAGSNPQLQAALGQWFTPQPGSSMNSYDASGYGMGSGGMGTTDTADYGGAFGPSIR